MKIAWFLIGLMLGVIFTLLAVSLDRGQFFVFKRKHEPPTIVKRIAKPIVKTTPKLPPTGKPATKRMTSAVTAYVQVTFGKQASTAFAIIREKSQGNCAYKGKDGTLGLFAIHESNENLLETAGSLNDCYQNIDVAYKIFQDQGWKAWGK